MRVLLQNAQNGLFFRCGNVWTSDAAIAFNFENYAGLFDYVKRQNLTDVQLVVRFNGSNHQEIIPIQPPQPTQAAQRAA